MVVFVSQDEVGVETDEDCKVVLPSAWKKRRWLLHPALCSADLLIVLRLPQFKNHRASVIYICSVWAGTIFLLNETLTVNTPVLKLKYIYGKKKALYINTEFCHRPLQNKLLNLNRWSFWPSSSATPLLLSAHEQKCQLMRAKKHVCNRNEMLCVCVCAWFCHHLEHYRLFWPNLEQN